MQLPHGLDICAGWRTSAFSTRKAAGEAMVCMEVGITDHFEEEKFFYFDEV